jgi:hypothetical protein
MEDSGEALRSDPCLAGLNRDTPNLSPACYDAAASRPLVALWGDSHSAAISPGLRAVARAQGYGFVQLGKASCPPLIGATHFIPRIPALAERCLRFNDTVLATIRADSRIRVVILSAAWAAPFYRDWQDGWLSVDLRHTQQAPSAQAMSALFVASLRSTIESLQSSGKQVMLVEEVPGFTIDPGWRVESARIPGRRRLVAWLGIANASDSGFSIAQDDPNISLANSLLKQAAGESHGAPLVDLKPALCGNTGLCAYRDGDRLLYVDGSHLSRDGALYAVRNLRLPATAAINGALHSTTE